MGFILALFYLMTSYLGTITVFGQIAKYHVQEILAAVVFFVSIPALQKTFLQKTIQSLALGGLAIAVAMSMLVGMNYYRGAMTEFGDFIPNAFAYFLVVLHCRTKLRLQILVLLLFFVSVFVIVNGAVELQTITPFSFNHPQSDVDDLQFSDAGPDIQAADTNAANTYLMPQLGADGIIWRLKGQNFIGDPNDFGQLLVCLLPLTFIFWRPKNLVLNLAIVLPMAVIIGIGIYLTHSRGALLAIMGVFIAAFRRKIGVVASVVLGGGLFVAAMALHATGGRDISADAGADRTALWGDGLALMKMHPLFGAGFNQMADIIGKTAHNSIIVCAAELGFFGLFCWSLFLLPTVRDAMAVASDGLNDAAPLPVDESPYAYAVPRKEKLDKAAIGDMGKLIFFSLVGFLICAMFLSRAFVMTFFLLGGMAEVVFQMALDRGMIAPRLPFGKAALYSGILSLLLVPGMYVVVRVLNLAH